MADMIGVSRQSINKWEKEDELPPSQYLLSLSKVLRSSIDWLLTSKEFQLQNSSIITNDAKNLPRNIKMDDNKIGNIIFGSYEGRFLTTNKRTKTVVIGGKQSGIW